MTELFLFLLPTLIYATYKAKQWFGPGWREDWGWAKVMVEEEEKRDKR